jgi:hypothetical protein
MSHKATSWAIQQRGIRPAAKIVLWHLCDRYHPDNGCFPSQETLADDCELSRSSLNDQLDALEKANLIRREPQRDDGNRQRSTRYRFAFEADFQPAGSSEPCPEIGHGSVSENHPIPCPKNAESRVRISDTNLVIEPVIEPERECAREEIAAFERARKTWPSGFADSREEALSAWLSLSPDDRNEAAAEIGRFINTTKAIGRKHFCGFAAYLREQRWKALPERPKPLGAKPVDGEVSSAPVRRSTLTKFQRENPHLFPDLVEQYPELYGRRGKEAAMGEAGR